EAHRLRLPLVVASRPQEANRFLDAAVLRLEPLSERAAFEHILAVEEHRKRKDELTRGPDAERVRKVVQHAEVVETPLYMRLARQLHDHGALRSVNCDAERSILRGELLARWTELLIEGKLCPDVALLQEERLEAIDVLGQIACIGLRRDRLEVPFDECGGLD